MASVEKAAYEQAMAEWRKKPASSLSTYVCNSLHCLKFFHPFVLKVVICPCSAIFVDAVIF